MLVELSCPSSSSPSVFTTVFSSLFAVFLLFDILGSIGVLYGVLMREKVKRLN